MNTSQQPKTSWMKLNARGENGIKRAWCSCAAWLHSSYHVEPNTKGQGTWSVISCCVFEWTSLLFVSSQQYVRPAPNQVASLLLIRLCFSKCKELPQLNQDKRLDRRLLSPKILSNLAIKTEMNGCVLWSNTIQTSSVPGNARSACSR